MDSFIEIQKVRPLLLEIKNQHIQIAVRNEAGKWSKEYFHIEYDKSFSTPKDVFFVVLRGPSTDKIFLLNLSSVTGIKLNKYLKWQGDLHSSFEIFHSKNLEYLKVPFDNI
jgi:hypothetical protein